MYLPFLEEAQERASGEMLALAGLFEQFNVPEGGRVLDVACGTGRHSIPLAQRGYTVTGIDLSPLFIQKAAEHAQSEGVDVRFVLGDAMNVERLLADEAPFDAIINMFTSNGYYGGDADLDLFRQLRRLASPEALLVVLTINRDWLVRNFEPEGLEKAGNMRILQYRAIDLETSTMLSNWKFFEGKGENLGLRLDLDMEHRLYSLHEFRGLLEETGWDYLQGLGCVSEDGLPLGKLSFESKDMWVAARA